MSTCWFSGGRLACSVADHGGIETLKFFGDQTSGRQGLFASSFRSAYPRIFRPQLLVGKKVYTLGIGDGALHPSGWTGRLSLPEEGITAEIALVCSNAALIQAARILKNPKKRKIGLRLMHRDHTAVEHDGRTWSPWKAHGGTMTCKVTDMLAGKSGKDEVVYEEDRQQYQMSYADEAEPHVTRIGVVGDRAVTMWNRHSLRAFVTEPTACNHVAIAVIFGKTEADFRAEKKRLSGKVSAAAWAETDEWAKMERQAPCAEGLPEVAASFVKQAPALFRALTPKDQPGGWRSNFDAYWIWGWDNLFQAHTLLLAGGMDATREMLELFERTAHPEWGIAHAFDQRMRLRLSQLPSTQGFFSLVAWHHWALTGDLATVRRHWPFISNWLKTAKAQPKRDGLFVGLSMYPDYPQAVGQNGNDMAAMDNSVAYQALRAIEQMADALEDAAVAEDARRMAEACRTGFRKRLWDGKRGYWFDSLDADTLEPRPSYPTYAMFWSSPFAGELIHDRARTAAFMEKNHRCPGGLRMLPIWDPGFNDDGNQLGQHYPPTGDATYLRLMAETGRQDRLREWLGWLETSWRQNTVPEGTTLEAENDGPLRPDNPGGKQFFSIKTWYEGLVGGILGLSFDCGGLTASAGLDGPLHWKGIPAYGRKWSIKVVGKGAHVSKIEVGGTTWKGTCKVPLPKRGSTAIVIHRTAKAPAHPVLRSADGAEALASETSPGKLTLKISAPTRVLLRFRCAGKPKVTIGGESVSVDWHKADQHAEVWLPGSSEDVEVVVSQE